MPKINVAVLPDRMPPRSPDAPPGVAVVIDVLRATTMMAALLDAGAVCSGTDGGRSSEDELAAGLLVDRLRTWTMTDTAEDTADLATGSIGASGGIEAALRRSFHAERLVGLGFDADVRFCAQLSVTRTVPALNRRSGLIVPG